MNYSKYANKVVEKLNIYGGSCKIIRKGESSYNPMTNKYESYDTEITGKALISSYDNNFINGTTVLENDVKIMCYLSDKPMVNDDIYIGSKKYNVVSIRELNPNGELPIYYTIQGR